MANRYRWEPHSGKTPMIGNYVLSTSGKTRVPAKHAAGRILPQGFMVSGYEKRDDLRIIEKMPGHDKRSREERRLPPARSWDEADKFHLPLDAMQNEKAITNKGQVITAIDLTAQPIQEAAMTKVIMGPPRFWRCGVCGSVWHGHPDLRCWVCEPERAPVWYKNIEKEKEGAEMHCFEYVVLKRVKRGDPDEGTNDKYELFNETPRLIAADSPQKARDKVIGGLPEDWRIVLDEVFVIVRPFCNG